jgi:hypothetical protein
LIFLDLAFFTVEVEEERLAATLVVVYLTVPRA